jgi:hypothetical protein
VKNYVHNGFRYPLPPWGRNAVGFVYFCIPVGRWILRYAVGNWPVSSNRIGPQRGELLKQKEIQGIRRYKRVLDNGTLQEVGGPTGILGRE